MTLSSTPAIVARMTSSPRRLRRLATVGALLTASTVGLGALAAGPALAGNFYCSDWDSGGMCTRLEEYDQYGSGRYQIQCRTTYVYVGRINGSDNYEISNVHCS